MKNEDIFFLSIAEAAELIAGRELSPVEIIDAHLERVERTDRQLNSFITLLRDESIAAAKRAEKAVLSGQDLGPLHGIPIGLKDLYDVKGVPTTVGSKILRGFVPRTDAAVTERFNEAGAIILGKLQMHEFALGGTSVNPHDGPAHNPWDTDCVTGGSSGGSGSAVASGQCMGALGSDTGGSVRIPSTLCGIVGLKPTFGRVSRYGVYPLSHSLDTVGPMTRTVRDAALVLNVIAGHDPRDPSSSSRPTEDYTASLDEGVRGVRIGVPKEYFFDVVDAEVERAVSKAARVLEGLGASVDQVSIPVLEHTIPISSTILLAEAAAVHMEHLRQRPDDIGTDVRGRLQQGALTSATDYIKAQQARTVFNRQVADAMQDYDLLLAPTAPVTAPRIDQTTVVVGDTEESVLALLPRLTRAFNICGIPTVSVPCGFSQAGMPIGMQLAGRPFDEATVLRVAHAYEQATDWHGRRPPI
ncbi:MAG: aspartyl/glutamyl-tRNA amidotransferase subunit A [Chloroflexi bacterium]|nr:aspartyl/glutamyl-tRNA amidotransferase subunit A [Chloroflexota bacterium]